MITEDNTNIYICCHKSIYDNVLNLKSKAYKILTPNDITVNNSELEVIKFTEQYDNRIYSEFSHLFHLAKRTDLKEYTGICHYRRYFNFKEDFKQIENTNFVITEPELSYNNILSYIDYHNAEDIISFTKFYTLLYKNDETMKNIWLNYCNSNICYTNNMIIIPTEEYKKLMNCVEYIITQYLNFIHLKTYDEWKEHVILNKEKYIKDYYPNNTITYNIRVPAYICERLISAIIYYYKTNVYKNYIEVSKIITEDKYNI